MSHEPEQPKSAVRAAIAVSLWSTGRHEAHVGALFSTWHAELVDDLCRLLSLVQAREISDIALARAAAEDSSAVSATARILYSARSLLRAAGHDEATTRPAPSGGNGSQSTPQRRNCAGLGEAFDVLVQAGVTHTSAPRGLIEALKPEAQTAEGMLRRTLEAVYGGTRGSLIGWLCGAPFLVDPAAASIALAETSEGARGIRDHLARAVAAMPGKARPRALAALNVVDAVLNAESCADSTSGVVSAAAAAVRVQDAADAVKWQDATASSVVAAAQIADAIWSRAPQDVPLPMRVRVLLDGLLEVKRETLTLCVNDSWLQPQAKISFADSASSPLDWTSLTNELDVKVVAAEPRPALELAITTSCDEALSDYLTADIDRAAAPNGTTCYAWPAAEPAIAFPVPAMTFSASRLNAYTKCPRRWFYDYLCDVIEDPGSLHAAYGRVVHEALEALHRYVRVPSRVEPENILNRLVRELDLAFGRARTEFSSQLEYEVSRMRGRRMAEQYVRWLSAQAARAPFEIIHVELSQRRRFGPHEFVGFIDRIDRPLDGGSLTIYDYKTGRVDTDAARYLEKIRSGEEAQLALYHAMRTAAGDEIGRIALVSIRDAKADTWVLALDVVDEAGHEQTRSTAEEGTLRVACSRADLDSAMTAIVERCNVLTTQGLAHYVPGEDPPCNYCAYARSCREKPAVGERIFAR